MPTELQYSLHGLEHPEKTSVNFFRLKGADIPFTSVFIVGFICILSMYGYLASFAVVAVWFGLMFRFEDARTYRLVVIACQDAWLLSVKRGVVWKALPDGKQSSPLPQHPYALGKWGILYDPKAKTDSILIPCAGSPFASLDPDEQESFVADKLAEMLKRSGALRDYPPGITMFYSRRPPNINPRILYYEDYAYEEVWQPSCLGKPRDQWTKEDKAWVGLHEGMHQLFMQDQKLGKRVDMIFMITIHHEGQLQKAVQRKGKGSISDEDILNLPIVQAKDLVIEELKRMGAEGVTDAMSFEELVEFQRAGWDVANIEEYYDNAEKEAEDAQQKAAAQNGSATVGPQTARQQVLATLMQPKRIVRVHKISRKRYCLQIDDNFLAVLKATRAPKIVYAHYFHQMYRNKIENFTIAAIGEVRRTTKEYMGAGVALNLLEGIREWLGTSRQGPRSVRREASLTRRQELLDTQAFSQSYNIAVLVVATSLKQLINECELMRREAEGVRMRPRWITNASRQLPAVVSVISGCSL